MTPCVRLPFPRGCPQPSIKDVIGAEKEKEFFESLETMGAQG